MLKRPSTVCVAMVGDPSARPHQFDGCGYAAAQADYDEWVENGRQGWAFANVLPELVDVSDRRAVRIKQRTGKVQSPAQPI
jgi:hypothetical protein